MNAFDAIALVAEEKIREAMEEGAFDDLPGAGKPLVLEDDSHIPPECRMACKILKNAGYCEGSTDGCFENSLDAAPEERQTYRSSLRLSLLLRKAHQTRSAGMSPSMPEGPDDYLPGVLEDSPYFEKILRKVPRHISTKD